MESIKQLRKICKKDYKEHITLRFYRSFSIYLTKIFIILHLSANMVTIIGFLTVVLGGVFYLTQHIIIGSILFFVSIVLDHTDGQIARYHKKSSELGGWLDSVIGHLSYPYFFLTLGLAVYFQTGEIVYIILGSLSAILKLVERSIPKVLSMQGAEQINAGSQDKGISITKSWVSHLVKAQVLFLIIVPIAFLNWQSYFLWVFTLYLSFFVFLKFCLTAWQIYSKVRNNK